MYDARNADAFRHAYIGFVIASRNAVDAFFAAALPAGGASQSLPVTTPRQSVLPHRHSMRHAGATLNNAYSSISSSPAAISRCAATVRVSNIHRFASHEW